MSDLIRLLPDSVANQIAAGEVVQRPGSAVKELMENAIDAGSTNIRLIIKDAGKSLIQVIDNGCGMSERDARMSCERHATSKILTANDLLSIRTLGFRGEALASVASVAQVEIRTKRTEDEIGTCLQLEGSEVKTQFPTTTQDGTTISVKNLFFNVPARRNFLKSNQVELRYIIDEFFRIAIANPSISLTFYNNDKLMYQLHPSNLKQRLIALYGTSYNERLVPVVQESNLVVISGFIGKPEFSRKTRGEQYFFTNGRYIRNPYLHHAIENAFHELIPKDAFATYFIFLTVDPGTIDVNIHPSKTEINFQEIKTIYAILHSSIRQAIGKFSISPTLDFETEKSFNIPSLPVNQQVVQPTLKVDPEFNPFEKKVQTQYEMPLSSGESRHNDAWQKLYDPLKNISFKPSDASTSGTLTREVMAELDRAIEDQSSRKMFQVRNRYIVTHIRSGIVIIDQQNAHERIRYDYLMEVLENKSSASQRQLLPQAVTIHPGDAELLKEHYRDLEEFGFEISEFGKDTFLVESIPAGLPSSDIPGLFEKIFEALKLHPDEVKRNRKSLLARSLAKNSSVQRGKMLQPEEISSLVEQLFSCKMPEVTPDGNPVMIIITYEDIGKKIK